MLDFGLYVPIFKITSCLFSDDHYVFFLFWIPLWTHVFKHILIQYVSIYCGCHSYWCSNCPIFGLWEALLVDTSACSNFLAFWYDKMFLYISCLSFFTSLILYISYARHGVCHLSKESSFPLTVNDITRAHLIARSALGYWVPVFKTIQGTILENLFKFDFI